MTTVTLKIACRLKIQNYQISIACATLIKSTYISTLTYSFNFICHFPTWGLSLSSTQLRERDYLFCIKHTHWTNDWHSLKHMPLKVNTDLLIISWEAFLFWYCWIPSSCFLISIKGQEPIQESHSLWKSVIDFRTNLRHLLESDFETYSSMYYS